MDTSKLEPGVYDLEERTAQFGMAVIQFTKTIGKTPVTTPLISQLVRAATSVGANYCEANDAVSKRDFRNKIGICRKESHETKHWLRMIATAEEQQADQARSLWKEAKELNLIFSKIFRSCSRNDK